MRWAIFYADRSVFSYKDGPQREAPWLGVIAIVQEDRHPCTLLHQVDNYWWRPDWNAWTGGDDFGFMQAAAMYEARWLKKGETVRGEDNREIMGRAGELKRAWDAEASS